MAANMKKGLITRFYNCRILRNHEIYEDNLWIREGKIVNPLEIFYREKGSADISIDCSGALISPGLIDLQINGGFGVDFSADIRGPDSAESVISRVSLGLLGHGVTSFAPTIVTSPRESYQKIIPNIFPRPGSCERGAQILGIHVEGPFISSFKRGAHPEEYLKSSLQDLDDLYEMYGRDLKGIIIITLAPEVIPEDKLFEIINKLSRESGIVVSLGHSVTDLSHAEKAINAGASMVTHLYNAMSSFHHREDSGLLGLLTTENIRADRDSQESNEKMVFFGLISDGIHSTPAALRLAYKANFKGIVLVTDAIGALGLSDGEYRLGQQDIVVTEQRALLKGTKDTLCGATTSLLESIINFRKWTRCSEVEALEAATLHPAQVLGIQGSKGTLDFGTDADFIILDSKEEDMSYDLKSTWINGKLAFAS